MSNSTENVTKKMSVLKRSLLDESFFAQRQEQIDQLNEILSLIKLAHNIAREYIDSAYYSAAGHWFPALRDKWLKQAESKIKAAERLQIRANKLLTKLMF